MYLGWRDRKSPSSQYVQIRGVDKAADWEESPFRNIHPINCYKKQRKFSSLWMLASMTRLELWMNVIVLLGHLQVIFYLQVQVLKLSPSLSTWPNTGCTLLVFRFYLLTTSECLHSDDGESPEEVTSESLEEVSSESRLETRQSDSSSPIPSETRQSDSSSPIHSSNPSTSGKFSAEVHSRNVTKLQQEPSLYIVLI